MTPIVQTLNDARESITPLLRKMVHRLDPSTRLVTSYHLGWCDKDGAPTNTNGGKAIRPALALLGAGVAGAEPEAALPGAVAVELVHNFSLVHDDLIDGDAERRHRPTVWAQWGAPTAVLAGDAMLSLAHEVLLDLRSPHARTAEAMLAAATRELIRGQTLDIAFESRRAVSLDECIDMARGKTGALISVSAAIGAVLTGAPTEMTDALAAYGDHLGVAFQLVDDLLGIWGQPEMTGKPVYSDLRSHKKTLPVTWVIENGGAAGRQLAAWLDDESRDPTDAELADIAELVEQGGGRAWATDEAARRAALADEAVTQAGAVSEPAGQLRALARYLIDREA
ncbi:polyprenyl synthetase family protein [Mycobacterium sp. Aquia_213]|uniref:polyprenyl synthetase family protein n=1 Tax=Mycobacterium sp. Aquia_213 TaxID=2991728 RepID=UPI002D1E3AE7|nr:polyprenyl synthetase family protein [Mycobacterium sp. Aquia_213]